MNLNPLSWFSGLGRSKSALQGRNLTAREVQAQGPWTDVLSDWVAREVAPRLYEALREAIPPIDAAINRLVTLDGIIRPEAESDRLQRAITDWMDNVRVNDLETGFQAFYRSQGNELYEQGFTVGEWALSTTADDVERLRVADSKGVHFRRRDGRLEAWYRPPTPQRNTRRDGTEQIERVLRNTYSAGDLGDLQGIGYRRLEPAALVYAVYNPEADSPYGVSLMRSMEFVARVLLTIDNATLQTWERFGNPAFSLNYKTNARLNDTQLEARRKTLADNLSRVLDLKRKGQSADFVNAVGRDDNLELKVIGGDSQVLELEAPARHILEQIVSKTGLPSWMLGFHWSTAERLAQRQGELVLQESRTRWDLRRPGLSRVVATALRARGVTWNEGDWRLVQDLPSLQDLVAQSQAAFLDAQTQLMLSGAGQSQPAQVTASGKVVFPIDDDYRKHAHGHLHKEPWVEDDPELPRLERATERTLLGSWRKLYSDALTALGLETGGKRAKAPEGPVFLYDPAAMGQLLMDLQEEFIATVGGEDAALATNMYAAWVRGVVNSAAELDADAVEESVRSATREAMRLGAMDLVKDAATRALREDIIRTLEEGAYDGLNPLDVARQLRARFDAHEVDWVRIARSEISAAQAAGKLTQYAAHEIEEYDWVAAPDSCPICLSRQGAGPYAVGSGPMPSRDSHPSCRCTVTAVER
ncbi:hypothetical protein [Thioalbus denitrificans]|uniref:SPP1 gp7 family putative phage head morphogenesis protein n=1 Tax=Thioalbus denitrificans TaxID=547122 RepID=A0A369CHY4_9GAMM|nr:hypothetical protein [Thioalbus denitrificans]RCX32067.1 SPP1 gp7 family putative phage head morphogenesis protein [Thioalbus denitrificans]